MLQWLGFERYDDQWYNGWVVLQLKRFLPSKSATYRIRRTVYITPPWGRFSKLDVSTVGKVSIPQKVVVGTISPRASRKRIAR